MIFRTIGKQQGPHRNKNIRQLCRIVFIGLCPFFSTKAQLKLIESSNTASFRGLSVVDDQVVWLAGNQGTVGRSVTGGNTWEFHHLPGFEKTDFRSVYGFDSSRAVVANAGSPAVILFTQNGGKNWQEVYRNEHKDAFIDGVDFWDEKHGMMYGDPVNHRMLLLKTSDGGFSWRQPDEIQRPKLDTGEASFAASGTNIRLWDKKKVAIASGGLKSRIWYSEDEGNSWKKLPVPILQGTDSRGIFTLHVDHQTWMVAGGDYKAGTLKKNHIFISKDSGKTWNFPEKPTRGYRECIAQTVNKTFIAVGPSGVDFSIDNGINWLPLSDQKGFHVVRKARSGSLVMLAGAKGMIAIYK